MYVHGGIQPRAAVPVRVHTQDPSSKRKSSPLSSVQVLLLDEIIPLPGDSLGFRSSRGCPNIRDASNHWLKLKFARRCSSPDPWLMMVYIFLFFLSFFCWRLSSFSKTQQIPKSSSLCGGLPSQCSADCGSFLLNAESRSDVSTLILMLYMAPLSVFKCTLQNLYS